MTPKLRILHLEDSIPDSELIRHMLVAEGIDCEIKRRDTREQFLEDLQKKDFDLIFADCTVPQFSGLHALELARKFAPEIPFIFVSGTIGEDSAIESLRNGATDYVLKHRLSRLVPAVRRAIAEANEKAKSLRMEERLTQSQRLEAVGTLAGGVAHDFNNILTIIKGHSMLLPMECDQPERIKAIANTIDRAAGRGTELISQLMAFARKSDGSFTSVNLNERLRDITSMLREAMSRNIVFELQLDETLPEVHADPGQVDRVIINLATNARDAMPNGGKIIFSTNRAQGSEVPMHTGPETAAYLRLGVTDTGTGMDEATRQHIFEPFFTTKPRGKGTGLGMPVVYGLMQSHNGLIDVKSELGKGTSIYLFFPIPTGLIQHQVEPPKEASQQVNGSETILVVDDESDVRYFVEVILQARGYNIISAGDAEEALEVLKTRPDIQLIFSDVGLPKLDGFALSNHAREINPHLKTILTSGYGDSSLKTKMVERGIEGFLAKPYDAATLLQTIRAVLDK